MLPKARPLPLKQPLSLPTSFHPIVQQIGFGDGCPLILAAHDMGAPPALLWAADHPEEIAGLFYIDGPVMLSKVLTKIIAYTLEAMKNGSMWWWILPFAPGVPDALVVRRITPRSTSPRKQKEQHNEHSLDHIPAAFADSRR